jgi:hypothetical protein
MAGATLENWIDRVAIDDRVSLQDAAQIIKQYKSEQHNCWSDYRSRKALVGALSQQRLEAYSDHAWYWVHDDPVGPDLECLILPSLWTIAHAEHCDHPKEKGIAPSADTMNWNTGEMRKWQWTVVAELPCEARKLASTRGNYDVVCWEFVAQQITVQADDLLRVANERGLANYARWLGSQPPRRPGRPINMIWESTKARLVAFAAINDSDAKDALKSKEGIKAYLHEAYRQLSMDGEEPDGRDLDRFATLVRKQLALANDSLGPP